MVPTQPPPYGISRPSMLQAFGELTPIYSKAFLVFSALLLRLICSRPFYS